MSVQFDLPAIDPGSVPAFATVKECAEWLESMPLTNAATAQGQLRAQIVLLARAEIKPAALHETLEQLREPVVFVQNEMAKKFAYRPLPMSDFEAGAWSGTLDLWRAFGACYQRCVQSVLMEERDLRSLSATVCQRAIDAQARLVLDILRANAEVPAAEWRLLHKLYRAAEHTGGAVDKVKDSQLRETKSTNCVATYARPILLVLGSPHEWTARQTQMIWRWTERWATKIVISHNPPSQPVKPPVLVNLDSGSGGYRPGLPGTTIAEGPAEDVRYLDISDLSRSIKNRVIRLRKGETPASLGLGEDATMPAAEQTLKTLYRHWCDGRTGRDQPRRTASGSALVASGLEAIHHYICGKPFKQPGVANELTARQRQEIATFGRVATRDDEDYSLIHGLALEQWEVRDESLAGLRLVRGQNTRGQRVAVGQLLAARPADARAFILGTVRWVQMLAVGDLMIGLQSIPGLPSVMAVRQAGLKAGIEKFQQGLLIPAVAGLQTPETAILPLTWFKPMRVIDIYTDQPRQIRLDAIVERGADFDRCTFAWV